MCVLGADGIRLRDLPSLTGTSREAVRWALGIMIRGRLAVEAPDPAANRGKVARLTLAGLDAQHRHRERSPAVPGHLAVRRPATLPHYPMVLHRGGYPDGS